jgi:hypothetical protein
MNGKTSASILLTVVILAGISWGLSLWMSGLEVLGWLLVIAAIVCLLWLWVPRKGVSKS